MRGGAPVGESTGGTQHTRWMGVEIAVRHIRLLWAFEDGMWVGPHLMHLFGRMFSSERRHDPRCVIVCQCCGL